MDVIKGFKDYAEKEALRRNYTKDIIKSQFKRYGFEPAETPVIEAERFVKEDNAQDEVISDIYKLQDKGKRKLALRYEFTFQLKRLAKNKKLPYKRYQIGPVFRDEPAKNNRLRQITQCDADIIGSTFKEEAEILSLSSDILRNLNLKVEIKVNNRKLINEILEKQNIKQKEEVIKEIDKLDKLPENEVKKNLKKYKADKILSIFKKPESYFKKYKNYNEIKELKRYCSYYNVKVNFQPSLARGLSYYNGTIFEIKTKKIRETIAAGGSYIINNIQSTGISFGLDRIANLIDKEPETTDYLIISINKDKEAIKILKKIREKYPAVIMFGKPSKALDYANAKNIKKAIIIGSEEIKKKKVTLKDMKTGKESLVSIDSLMK